MNSLALLLCAVTLAAAKPSAVWAPAPAIVSPSAAVSRQSRLDIIPATRTVITQPAVLQAPILARAAIAPVAIAPAAIAPAAVSTQSRIDIRDTPAIATTLVSPAPVGIGYGGLVSKVGLRYGAPMLANPLGTGIWNTGYAGSALGLSIV